MNCVNRPIFKSPSPSWNNPISRVSVKSAVIVVVPSSSTMASATASIMALVKPMFMNWLPAKSEPMGVPTMYELNPYVGFTPAKKADATASGIAIKAETAPDNTSATRFSRLKSRKPIQYSSSRCRVWVSVALREPVRERAGVRPPVYSTTPAFRIRT